MTMVDVDGSSPPPTSEVSWLGLRVGHLVYFPQMNHVNSCNSFASTINTVIGIYILKSDCHGVWPGAWIRAGRRAGGRTGRRAAQATIVRSGLSLLLLLHLTCEHLPSM